jgi:hypothetical protein
MKNIASGDSTQITPLLCQHCGALMRLVGSEPHPVQVETDLLTYSCTGCSEFLVIPLRAAAD